MDRITRFSLKNAAAVILLVVLVTAGGLWSAMQLKKETMPDIAIPIVAVVTPYPGAAPGDVYDQVTKPLEKALRGVDGIEEVSAQSNDSVSIVITSFSFSQDMDEAERNVNKVLSTVKLPENTIAPTVSRISFGSAPIMKLAVIAEKPEDTAALRADVRDRVIPALQGVQGVGEAKIAADSPAVVKIELDPKKLKKKGLTASGVIDQLKAANLSFPVGTVDLGKTTEPIRVGGSIESVDDIKDFKVAIYPNQNKIMGDAFAQIGKGMGALGKGMGALGSGMGQGFAAVGDGHGPARAGDGRSRHAGRPDQRDPAGAGAGVLTEVRRAAAAEGGGLADADAARRSLRRAAGPDRQDSRGGDHRSAGDDRRVSRSRSRRRRTR